MEDSIVVCQKVVGGQVNKVLDALRRLTASKPYNTYIKVINILYNMSE